MALFGGKSLKEDRKQADRLLHMAYKVYNYRKDVLEDKAIGEILESADELKELIKDPKLTQDRLEKQMKKVDALISKYGSKIYPVTFWSENVEMFLVAAILAIGIRTFFFQPFKIPTNSMYPTYAGMVAHDHGLEEGTPGVVQKAWDKFSNFTSNYEFRAPASGKLQIRVDAVFSPDREYVRCQIPFEADGRMPFLGVLSTAARRYQIMIGGETIEILLPMEFGLEDVIAETFYKEERFLDDIFLNKKEDLKLLASHKLRNGGSVEGYVLSPDIEFKKGDKVLNFAISTGDMLFVDRFSYNFFPPEVGDPFVFRTEDIDFFKKQDEQKYYIKRLVGKGGDDLSISDYALLNDSKVPEGSYVFNKNNAKTDGYHGYPYINDKDAPLASGQIGKIKEDHYFAMGDNSYHSYDSRYWGQVPNRAVIGKAAFIFYPFTKRWGVAE